MDDAAEEKATDETDEDEAVVEDVTESDKPPKTKEITVEEWLHMNSQPPIWMRCVLSVTVACQLR